MEMSMKEYYIASRNHEGYCTECKKLTRDRCEPDAENYPCPDCENNSVFGVENAMLIGYIDITSTKGSRRQGWIDAAASLKSQTSLEK